MKSQQMPGRPLSFRGMSGGVSAAVRLLRAAFRLMAADRVETLVRSTSWLRSIMPSYCPAHGEYGYRSPSRKHRLLLTVIVAVSAGGQRLKRRTPITPGTCALCRQTPKVGAERFN